MWHIVFIFMAHNDVQMTGPNIGPWRYQQLGTHSTGFGFYLLAELKAEPPPPGEC